MPLSRAEGQKRTRFILASSPSSCAEKRWKHPTRTQHSTRGCRLPTLQGLTVNDPGAYNIGVSPRAPLAPTTRRPGAVATWPEAERKFGKKICDARAAPWSVAARVSLRGSQARRQRRHWHLLRLHPSRWRWRGVPVGEVCWGVEVQVSAPAFTLAGRSAPCCAQG